MNIAEAWDAICDVPVPNGYELAVNVVETVTKSGPQPTRLQIELHNIAKRHSNTCGIRAGATADELRRAASDLVARCAPAPTIVESAP